MTDNRPPRFVCMDLAEADRACATITTKENFVTDERCPSCKRAVFLHCAVCRIQVTGCLDSEIDRFGKDEAWRRAVERYGAEVARQHYENMGLWAPPEFRLEK